MRKLFIILYIGLLCLPYRLLAKAGLRPAGPHQVSIKGKDIELFISAGSIQIDVPTPCRCLVPYGARYRERPVGTHKFGKTTRAAGPKTNESVRLDKIARRVIFLNGRIRASSTFPVRLKGNTSIFIRGYNAVLHYRAGDDDEFSIYRFDIRDPAKEAREEKRRKERLERLGSLDPLVRQREEFLADGGLYGMFKRATNGVFQGF